MYDPLSPKPSSAKDSVTHFTLNSDLFTSFLSTHCGRLSGLHVSPWVCIFSDLDFSGD